MGRRWFANPRIGVLFCALLPALDAAAAARAQTAAVDAALRDRVVQLVDRLDAPKAEARDAAMASLIKLGPPSPAIG